MQKFLCVIYLVPFYSGKISGVLFFICFWMLAILMVYMLPVEQKRKQLHSKHIQLCYKWAKAAKIVVWIMPFISLWLLFKQISSSLQWLFFSFLFAFLNMQHNGNEFHHFKTNYSSWAFLNSLSRSLWNRAVGVSTTDDLDSFLAIPKTQHANAILFCITVFLTWNFWGFLLLFVRFAYLQIACVKIWRIFKAADIFLKQLNTSNGVNLCIS